MKLLSIKRLYIWTIAVIVSVALLVSSAINLLNQIEFNKQSLVDDVKLITSLTSRWATELVIENKIKEVEKRLTPLASASFIENLHIYRFDDKQELNFFTSYKQDWKIQRQTYV